MNRQIKFRVYDKDTKRMHICGENVHDSMMFRNNTALYYNLQNGCGSMEDGTGTYDLMQWTGLKDVNGVEIYEGDILGSEQFSPWVVKHDGTNFTISNICNPNHEWYLKSEHVAGGDRYVIGNIHENPELLEVRNG